MVHRPVERPVLPAPPSPQDPDLLSHLVRLAVSPPPPGEHFVPRPQALAALEHVASHQITLVAAPAGYGKTTLLSAWAGAGHEGAPPRRVAWVSLGPEQDDPSRYAGLVTAAFHHAGVPLRWAPPGIVAARRTPELELVYVLDAVAEDGAPCYLVLDGYDVLSAPAAHDLTMFLINHAPPNLHLIIAVRGEPPLPLARLRLQGRVADLPAEALRWSVAEAGTYLNSRLGLGLDAALVAELQRRTEGWITGLGLAALSLTERGFHADSVPGLAEHSLVASYLVGEVLEREAPAMQRFVMLTAMLSELSGALVERLLLDRHEAGERAARLGGFATGQAVLAAVQRRGLFLEPLASRPGWYRYHGLFAEVMRSQLRQQGPVRTHLLQTQASVIVPARVSAADSGPVPRGADPTHALLEPLSKREQEALELLAVGKANREIAAVLHISEGTVKSHLKHIFAKLGARNRTEAVALARELQLLGR